MADLKSQFSLGLRARRSWGKYILAGLIGALAACLAVSVFTPATTLALSQDYPPSADGLFALEARLSSGVYGLYLIDTRNQNILLYRYGGPGSKGLRLLAARSFRYDRQLLDFNSGKPSPRDVRMWIEATPKTPLSPKTLGAKIPDGPESAPADREAPE